MVLPGNPILQSDLADLATVANGKSTLPKYNTPGDPASGNRDYDFIEWPVTTPGGAWSAGATVTLGALLTDANGNSQQASTAGVSGGSTPAWPAADAVPGVTTTDGAVIWTCVNIILPRYEGSTGSWSASTPMALGTVIRDSNFAYQKCTTAGTTKSGAHPTWATSVGGNTTDNTVVWTLIALPRWLTELNRLRGNLQNTLTADLAIGVANQISPSNIAVSGKPDGWPINAPSAIYGRQWFYYEDTGTAGVITIASLIVPQMTDFSTLTYDVSGTKKMIADVTRSKFKMGGTASGLMQCDFFIRLFVDGTTTGAAALVALTADFPIESSFSFMESSTNLIVVARVNTVLTPGDYTFTVTVTQDSATQLLFGYWFGIGTSYGIFARPYNTIDTTSPYFHSTAIPSVTTTFTTSVDADGIDTNHNLKKIELEVDALGYQWGFHPIVKGVTNGSLGTGTFGASEFDATNVVRLYYPITGSASYLPFDSAGVTLGYQFHNYPAGDWIWEPFSFGNPAEPPDGIPCFDGVASYYYLDYGYIIGNTTSGTVLRDVDTLVYSSTGFTFVGFLTMVHRPMMPAGWNNYPWPQPIFTPEYVYAAAWTISTNVSGLWSGVTPMVSNLNAVNPTVMPWNFKQNKAITGGGGATYVENPMLLGNLDPGSLSASNSYLNTLVVEQQSEPPVWQATTWFTLGFTILDSNGNFQTVSTAGRSGSSAPTWATSGITADGSTLRWTFARTPPKPIVPAVHRPQSIPRYPFYWESETIAKLKPPLTSAESEMTNWGAGLQWNQWSVGNHALGWWIYSVSLNRVGVNYKNGRLLRTQDVSGNPEEVSVTIGCMRSGSFVSFGTYTTGQTVQVLWPIFTTDALVYQCAERVDIQAVAIANGGAGVTVGTTAAGYPVCAAFVSDVTALLALIS